MEITATPTTSLRAHPSSIYSQKAFEQIERLIADLDKNPLSSTYGCFDRSFWHLKISDFPNINRQVATLTLALAYKYPFTGNILYQNPVVKEWVKAAIRFSARTSHRDGSCDEFFPNERSFFGAAINLSTYIDSVIELDINDTDILEFLKLRARWVAQNTERTGVANHHAVASLSLFQAHRLFGTQEWIEGAQVHLKDTLALQDPEEGWFFEYGGFDSGYLAMSLDFLTRIHEIHPTEELQKAIHKAARFFVLFINPDGSYGGSEYSSRGSSTYYPAGLERLARADSFYIPFANLILHGIQTGRIILPTADHHYGMFTHQYLQAALLCNRNHTNGRPALENGVTIFPKAGIFRLCHNQHLLVAATTKGGSFKFSTPEKTLAGSTGYLARLSSGTLIGSQVPQTQNTLTQHGNLIVIEAAFTKCSEIYPNQITFLVFRFLCLIPWFGPCIKHLLVRLTIQRKKPTKLILRREISWDHQGLKIRDYIKGPDKDLSLIESLVHTNGVNSIHVPGAKYFHSTDLTTPTDHTATITTLKKSEWCELNHEQFSW